MDHHILVLAMSTLTAKVLNEKPELRKSYFQFKEDGRLVGEKYECLGQLEPIPQYLSKGLGESITHVVMLNTRETQNAQRLDKRDEVATARLLAEYYDKRYLSMEGFEEGISAVDFFKRRMQWLGICPVYIEKTINLDSLSVVLAELQDEIRELYRQNLREGGSWRLWLDTHGSFREISMAMFGIMQMLAAPDEQELAESATDPLVSSAIKRLSDGRDRIPVTGVYTVGFDASKKTSTIVDLTEFYSNFISPAITAYLNYGQYAQLALKPDAIVEEDGHARYLTPYAFVSYKHGDDAIEFNAVLGTLRKAGIRYWYDDGIDLGTEWEPSIEDALNNCEAFVAMFTQNYLKSGPCVSELRSAIDQGKKILFVALDENAPIYGLKEDVRVVVGSEECVIRKEELERLSNLQHVELRTFIREKGAFQYPSLVDKLKRFGLGV